MEVDELPIPGPAQNGDSRASTEKSLLKSRNYKALLRRENKGALQALCQDYGLDDTLSKTDLAIQLIEWVSVPRLQY